MTYAEAKAKAQSRADESGFDQGVYAVIGGYSSQMLPQRRDRYGWENRCEVVSCTDLGRCQPGHGPAVTREPPRLYGAGSR